MISKTRIGLLGNILWPLLASHGLDDQPRVQPGPSEPDWIVILDRYYRSRMIDDLINPASRDLSKVRGRFRRAKDGPIVFRPILALGLEVPIHGGFYVPGDPEEAEPDLWSYQFKSTARDLEAGTALEPPLTKGSITTFDPGKAEIGLWVGNDQFNDRVYTEPTRVARRNARLRDQPYKVMIYPYRDPKTGNLVSDAYLIGWEYSTNDDFQDVVCILQNVILLD